jgi:EpsI family protein
VKAYVVACSMLLVAAAAWWLKPEASDAPIPNLAQVVPTTFGDWKEISTGAQPIDPTRNENGAPKAGNPYDDVLMRAYSNSHGDVVMLALAYGRSQRQEVKIHRPELCYVAQGFRLLSRSHVTFPAGSPQMPAQGERMLVQTANRVEAVSYWIRIGGIYSRSAWLTRYYIFEQGLEGKELDGVLVRVSQILGTPAAASDERYQVQEQFVADLVRAMPSETRHLLTVGADA